MLLSLRGKGGGYRLARAPKDYTAREILSLTEGSLAPVECMKTGDACERAESCPTRPMWRGLDRVIAEYLDSWTLEALTRTTEDAP